MNSNLILFRRALFLSICNFLLRFPGHRFRLLIFRRLANNIAGPGTVIERGVRVSSRGGVSLGRGCIVNSGVLLDGRGGLTIGDLVNVSEGVQFLTDQHLVDSPSFEDQPKPVSIADRCWIATRAIVLPGTILGEGVVVAAGSVVHGEHAPFAILAGAPARFLRSRSTDAQTSLPPYRRFWH